MVRMRTVLMLVASVLTLAATTQGQTTAGEDPEERVALPVVVNVLKGIGCTDEEMAVLIEDAIKRANEVLKPAGVILVVEKTNTDVTGDGNADEDATADDDELRKLRDEGLKEVTGEGKKGLKITFAKKFALETVDDQGNPEPICPVGVAQLNCTPWIGIAKSSTDHPHDEGETVAHEVGHALGKLPDTYEKDECEHLMYGWAKENSPLSTSEAEREKILKGAKDFGGRVLEEGEDVEAPKIVVPGSRGAGSSVITQEPEPDEGHKPIIWVSIHVPDSFDDLDETGWAALLRCWPTPDGASPASVHFVHIGVDVDDDPATGFPLGPFSGVEFHMILTWDPATDLIDGTIVNLDSGETLDFPVDASPTAWETDVFDLPGGAISPSLPLNEKLVSFSLDGPAVGMVFPAPTARFAMMSTSAPLPPDAPGPLDDVLEVGVVLDDSIGEPALVTDTGLAVQGEVLTVTGANMVAGETVEVRVNDTPVAEVTVGDGGGFDLPLLVEPALFGADGTGYDFIVAKGSGGAAVTWVHTASPGGSPDVNGDGVVDVADLVQVILAWGPCPPACPEDIDGDGQVGVADLVLVVLGWG